MKIKVLNHYTDQEKVFEGESQQIEAQLLRDYPWLQRYTGDNSFVSLLEALDGNQAYSVWVDE